MTSCMTAAELKALHDAATPGVWGSKGFAITVIGSGGLIGYPPTDGCIASLDDGEYIANKNAENDAALIVAVKNNLPAIIEAMEANERMAEQLAEVTAERDDFQSRLQAAAQREKQMWAKEKLK